MFSLTCGNELLVKCLVELVGINIHEENYKGETALFNACQKGHCAIVKYLVEHGANINKVNDVGETPLFNVEVEMNP